MEKHQHISFPDRFRLELLILAEVARLRNQAECLGNLDEEVLGLAQEAFGDERQFVIWLVTRAHHLNGITPLSALGSEEGRQAVVRWLKRFIEAGHS